MSNGMPDASDTATPLIDVNVSWGAWPFQRFADDTLEGLAYRLTSAGIVQAWISHVGGILHADPRSFNLDLIEDVRNIEMLRPVPVINPVFSGWANHLNQLRGESDVPAVKLYPAHHNYSLVDREFVDPLVDYLGAYGLKALICLRVEDERTRYHGLRVVGHPVDDVIAFGKTYPEASAICLNAYLPEARRIGQETDSIGVDISFTDWMFVLEELLTSIDIGRVYFGSHSPFLYTGAIVDKLMLSRLTNEQKARIGAGNAQDLLAARV